MSAEQNADIIRMAQRLEGQLAERGGLGRGLGEYARSLSGELPPEILHDIMKINRVRNDLVHRDIDQALSEHDRRRLQESYQRASAYLAQPGTAPPPLRVNPWAMALAVAVALTVVWLMVALGPPVG
ncbi:hypothetical protein ACFP81_01180 [Deinococcus lacus]|uniref:DUF4145 domain-containing protein n=1 Tax=Deinococcus lacus TaxID=392561 RepID=A0ABW1Y9A8_9DEIO